MIHNKLALLGFGNVGRALARLLLRKRDEIRDRYQISFTVTGIGTGRHGTAVDPGGINLEEALRVVEEGHKGGNLSALSTIPNIHSPYEFIDKCGADVLFENTPVNYESGQPAVDHLRAALQGGMHAITANKGPVVHAYTELKDTALLMGRRFYFESTVMDGAPLFSLFRETLPAAQVKALYGVLNSTTNLILTRMEAGESFEQAVAYAQKIGIAETDPSGDVDGWDSAVKVAALVTVMMGIPLKPSQVDRTGIRGLNSWAIQQAPKNGERWKLVCSARRDGENVEARVAPQLVPVSSPLYGIDGTTSIVQFETDVLGLLSIIESDPGPETTAYGLLADYLNAVRNV
jgi:homoserine dehydrogenase